MDWISYNFEPWLVLENRFLLLIEDFVIFIYLLVGSHYEFKIHQMFLQSYFALSVSFLYMVSMMFGTDI